MRRNTHTQTNTRDGPLPNENASMNSYYTTPDSHSRLASYGVQKRKSEMTDSDYCYSFALHCILIYDTRRYKTETNIT